MDQLGHAMQMYTNKRDQYGFDTDSDPDADPEAEPNHEM
jgi:hypothetical protein